MPFSKPDLVRSAAALVVALAAAPAQAEPPRALADIPPVHSLVARVMQGVGEPGLIVPPGASPHGYALRPSEAGALAQAEAVFWIGEALAPWLGEAVETLAPNALAIELAEVQGVTRLPYRVGGTFEKHAHGDDDDHAKAHGHDHGHDQADDHDHDHDHGHDHGERHADDHDGHAHDAAYDSHLWLDPENAKVWLTTIAAGLSEADPENASVYFANAAAGRAEIDALIEEISTMVAPVRDRGFIVFHDAYQYFEARFGLSATGSIALGDASQPGAGRVAEIRALIEQTGAACVFSEPQFQPRVIEAVIEGTQAKKGVLDPVGAELTPGPDLYPELLRMMGRSLIDCLG